MVAFGGKFYLLFSGGSTAHLAMRRGSPSAPHRRVLHPDRSQPDPVLLWLGGGPGGGSLFQDSLGNYWLDYAGWTACTSYSCRARAGCSCAPVTLSTVSSGINEPAVDVTDTPNGKGYWLSARDGGIFTFGNAAFYGSTGALAPECPDRGHGLPRPMARVTGSSPPTAASSPSATPASTARGRTHLNAPIWAWRHPRWPGLLAGRLRRGHLHLRRRPYRGSTGGTHLNVPVVGMADDARWQGLLAGRLRRRHLHLRRRPLPRPTGASHLNSAHRGHGIRPPPARVTGWWPLTGASSASRRHLLRLDGRIPLNQPIVGMATSPDGRRLQPGGLRWRHLQLRRCHLRPAHRPELTAGPTSAAPLLA